jgi:hypothetical protein
VEDRKVLLLHDQFCPVMEAVGSARVDAAMQSDERLRRSPVSQFAVKCERAIRSCSNPVCTKSSSRSGGLNIPKNHIQYYPSYEDPTVQI